jgi:hypothetical protein
MRTIEKLLKLFPLRLDTPNHSTIIKVVQAITPFGVSEMTTAIKASNVRENDIVAFRYNGKPRVCLVLQVSDTWFRAEMADGSGYRCFSHDKIESEIEHAATK